MPYPGVHRLHDHWMGEGHRERVGDVDHQCADWVDEPRSQPHGGLTREGSAGEVDVQSLVDQCADEKFRAARLGGEPIPAVSPPGLKAADGGFHQARIHPGEEEAAQQAHVVGGDGVNHRARRHHRVGGRAAHGRRHRLNRRRLADPDRQSTGVGSHHGQRLGVSRISTRHRGGHHQI